LERSAGHLFQLSALVRVYEAFDLLDRGPEGVRDLLLRLLGDVLVIDARRETADHDRADRHLRPLVDEDPCGVRSVIPRELVEDFSFEGADPVLWSWMPPITGPPNRGERMCSCTRIRTRASARASSLCRTCRFISSPSKSALYGGQTARLKRNVLCGITRTSCAIMDIRCKE